MDHPLIAELRNDDVYGQFFAKDFDPSRFANNIIEGSSIAKSLEQLSHGIERLETELHSQVIAHHDDLLLQATGIQQLEDVLKMVGSRVASLSSSIERIHDKVQKPYTKIVARTSQLMRLQSACELLRRTLRFMYLAKRLKGQLQGGNREIAKAATTITEINALTEIVDLSGIEVVDAESGWIAKAKSQIHDSAKTMLELSIQTQNQVQLGTALQVFRSLELLETKVSDIVRVNSTKVINASIDIFTDEIFHDGDHQSVSLAARRATLWTKMEQFMDIVKDITVQVRHLERVLSKKRDHATQFTYLEELSPNNRVSTIETFWSDVMEGLRKEFNKLALESPFIESTFQGEYPKLLRLLSDLCVRIAQQSSSEAQGVHNVDNRPDDIVAARNAISIFETKYLSHSLNRMFDPVQLVFPAGGRTPPSVDEVVNICKTLQKELHVTSSDQRLSLLVSKNVAKTAKLYFVKTENMVSTDEEAIEVGKDTSAGHLRNISLANRLDQLCKGLKSIINSQLGASLSEESANIIEAAIVQGDVLLDAILSPLFAAIAAHLEKMIRYIHYEDYSSAKPPNPDDDGGESCSRYIGDLNTAAQHMQSKILMRLTCKDVTLPRTNKLVERLYTLFVRHVCLISRLSEVGKMRLASDMAQLELALAPFDCSPSDLGDSYKALRALRPILFTSPKDLVNNPSATEFLPLSNVLLHMFAYAPDDLERPHTVRGSTLEQFSRWMDNNPDEKVVALIRSSLNTYADLATSRGDTSFHEIYPVMMAFCERVNQ
eukprot:m.175790 g.175790  ORF g.175790 m.175790 type:complete len:775 (+) comp31830_c0_seq1:347-2671(+)